MRKENLIVFLFVQILFVNGEFHWKRNRIESFLRKFERKSFSIFNDDDPSDQIDIELWNLMNEQEIKQMPKIDDFSDEENARRWFEWYSRISERFHQIGAVLMWRYETNITIENQKAKSEQEIRRASFVGKMIPFAQRFNENLKNSENHRIRTIFRHLAHSTNNDQENVKKISALSSKMTKIYSTTKIYQNDSNQKPFSLSPDLENLMQTEKNYDRLIWAWRSWHDQCGNQIRPIYLDYIDLINKNLQANGLKNLAEHWIKEYEMGNSDEFEKTVDNLLDEIMPLYRELHGYVRGRLCEIYPNRFDCEGPIPGHLLGNMWAQSWQSRFDDFIPYPSDPLINITEVLEEKSISIHKMYQMAESFFTSIGLFPMTKKFWSRSLFEKPTDREVVCHAAAADFDYHEDFRVRICTERNEEYFYTIHHEMGHIEYYMSYDEAQPFVYRNGANSAFHEAIGDTIGIYAISPTHLSRLEFLKPEQITEKLEINYLLRIALQKIAFLPFGYVMDKYRFALFRGEIDRENELNSAWWKLRIKYGGIKPPIDRNDSINFDPGAKYHVPSNVPYFRYFIAHVLQFQFYRSMCQIQGHRQNLHLCNIYGDKNVGKRFKKMLSLGNSEPWPKVLETLNGENRLSSEAILEYFHPLYRWLKSENKARNYPVGWE